MPLFHIDKSNQAKRLSAGQFVLEKGLQSLIEVNMIEIFGISFVAHEFIIGGEVPGRIDTLGLDGDGSPTIIEYKRSENASVITQGVTYMEWLIDHKGDFTVAARDHLGHDIEVDWSNPRLIIIANTYGKWDVPTAKRIGEGIELWSYTLYGDDLLYLELVYGQPRSARKRTVASLEMDEPEVLYTIEHHLENKTSYIQEMFYRIREFVLDLSVEEGEIIETVGKIYVGYRHGRNFCEIHPQASALKIWLDIPFESLDDPHGLARDVSSVGHWGTGHTELKVENEEQLTYVLGLIQQSYQWTL